MTAVRPVDGKKASEPPSWRIGDRYELRPLGEGDEVDWYGYLRDARVRWHTSFPDVDLAAVRGMVLRTVDAARRALGCRWALVDPEAGLIGTCGFSTWSLVHAHAELVYDLSPVFWGQGLMRRSVETVLGWAFDTAGFHRVHAVVMTTNEPSVALLERIGFHREGLLRGYRVARGEPRDFLLYSLLRGDPGSWRRSAPAPGRSGDAPDRA